MKKVNLVLLFIGAGLAVFLGADFIPMRWGRLISLFGAIITVSSFFYLLLKIRRRDEIIFQNKFLAKAIALKEGTPILSSFPGSLFLLWWTGIFGILLLVLEIMML